MQLQGRPLSDKERNALHLLQIFEDQAQNRVEFTPLILSDEALSACHRMDTARPIRVERIDGIVWKAWFSLQEFNRYVQFVCLHVKFKVELDGTVKTDDGITINRIWPRERK